jgi:ABC-type glutathione transport system ATPase component
VSSEPLIELCDVHKHYRSVHALDGVSLSIMPGETLGMVGESGCGKSTVARLALGLERPTRGELRFRGRAYPKRTRRLKSVRRHIGIVFQDPYDSLDPRFTLQRIVDEPLRAHGLPHDPKRIAALLTSVGMEHAPLDSYPGEYSGGQRQRIGIARALALEPELVVCDEPTSALDVSVQAQILNLLLQLQRERGLAYLFISHDLEVVRRMSDRLAVIYAGQIVETGDAARITAAPRHPYTRTLLEAVPATRPSERRAGEPQGPAGEIGEERTATGDRR